MIKTVAGFAILFMLMVRAGVHHAYYGGSFRVAVQHAMLLLSYLFFASTEGLFTLVHKVRNGGRNFSSDELDLRGFTLWAIHVVQGLSLLFLFVSLFGPNWDPHDYQVGGVFWCIGFAASTIASLVVLDYVRRYLG